MKSIILTIKTLLFITYFGFAQPIIKFKTESFDFGELEEGIMATYAFEITNTGKVPLIISNVAPSCGCTTPEWSKDPIAPGKKSIIKATYNTQGRPGAFNKSISVTSNAENGNVNLFLRGTVSKKVERPEYTALELQQSPRMVLKKNDIIFGKVEQGQRLSAKIEVKNLGRSNLVITEVVTSCNCVTHIFSKDQLKPGETGILELIYNPRGNGDITDIVTIKSNDLVNYFQKVALSSNIVDNLAAPNMMKQEKSSVPFK